jgi:hypothetical protein
MISFPKTFVLALTLITVSAAAAEETPAKVVGSWRYGSINPVTYWDASTGQYRGHGGGTSRTYVFDDAGHYKMYQLIQTNNYGWQMSIFTFEDGKATWSADTVTLTPTAGKYRCTDNRVKKNNHERDMTEEERKKNTTTEKWHVANRHGKPVFVTGTSGKDEIVFRREDDSKSEKK